MKSAGYKKDLLVAIFCGALLQVSNQDFEDDEVLSIEIDTDITKELKDIYTKIQTTLNNSDNDVKEWIARKTRTKIPIALNRLDAKVVNLELLALYVLFVNFVERDNPLDEDLKYLSEIDHNMELAEKLNNTEIGRLEAEMFKLSYDVINFLKG